MTESLLKNAIEPDWEGLYRCIMRDGTPERVHYIELFLDWEIQEAICARYRLLDGLSSDDPAFHYKRQLRLERFLGYDFIRCGVEGMAFPMNTMQTDDTAALKKSGGRHFVDEHKGPITNWEEFEKYPWPDPEKASTQALEWYQENLPDGMCIIGSGGFAHFAEFLNWLMGYETLCYALYDQRDLVAAMAAKLTDIFKVSIRKMLEFDRVKFIWGSDDMGFKTGTLIGPKDMREFVLPGHKIMAQMAHDAGRPYLLHSCGNLESIMEDLIADVGIDAKHSFEDTIESVIEDKQIYGDRIALLGGIDVDFLCRSDEKQVRERVRRTLEACMPGGGYVLGTGNSVANYIPVDNYLAMLDEGRR
ncbi:MAG TPA: uroporphyrinogen decarboxylase family protein [Candidatus Brocadiia bacterium]|nr:uroporphyrinogen decarboxylase family protein [Candidatus Brocadiia bacterium]